MRVLRLTEAALKRRCGAWRLVSLRLPSPMEADQFPAASCNKQGEKVNETKQGTMHAHWSSFMTQAVSTVSFSAGARRFKILVKWLCSPECRTGRSRSIRKCFIRILGKLKKNHGVCVPIFPELISLLDSKFAWFERISLGIGIPGIGIICSD